MKKSEIILVYHSVGEHPTKEVGASLYAVPPDRFREQMEYVAEKKGTVPFGDSPLFSSPILTFDDGDITNYSNAFPVLKEAGLKGYFFIIGTRVGTDGYMDWSEIKEMRDAGMVIGSHGMTHRILTELSDDDLRYELVESKKILEEHLNSPVDYFSVPRGLCNEKIASMAKRAGYKGIFTSDIRDMDGFRFGRIVVRPSWNIGHFKRVLNSGYLLSDKIEDALKNSFKGMLGIKNYDKLRTALLKK